jgi:hypothetical protein
MNFSIEMLNDTLRANDECIAKIKIGDLEESFTLSFEYSNINDYLSQWYSALSDLLKHYNSVALMQSLIPNNEKRFRRGWVLYKAKEIVYIQDRLFPTEYDGIQFDKKGVPLSIPQREIYTEEGDKISEWQTTLSDVYFFLESVNAF